MVAKITTMLTATEKLAIKQILKAPPDRRAELETLLTGLTDTAVLDSVRDTLSKIVGVKNHVNNPKKIGVEQAQSVRFNLGAACHQTKAILGDLRSDLTTAIGWDEEIDVEAF